MNNLSLPKEALTAYLYDVGALETAKDQIEQEEEAAKAPLEEALAKERKLVRPESPTRYAIAQRDGRDVLADFIMPLVVAFVFVVITAVLIVVIGIFVKIPNQLAILIGSGVLGLVIGIWFCVSSRKSAIRNVERSNLEAQERYAHACREYQKESEALRKQIREIREESDRVLSECGSRKEKIEELLQKEYSLGILHSQYQNREAVLVMYGMFTNGRCDTLKEALNAYEDYLWKKNDEKFMQAVTKELDDICETQEEVVRQVEAMREQTDALAEMTESKFEDLQATAEEIAARNEVIEDHARTAAFLETIQFLESR